MRKKLTPEAVLNLVGVDYFERTNRLAYCCIWHADSDPSAGFYLDTELAHCFSCKYVLSPVDFYAKFRQITREEAIKSLEKEWDVAPPKRFEDQMGLAKARTKAEALLQTKKSLQMEVHAYFGEELDRLLLAYRRAEIDKLELDKLLKIWYNSVEESTDATQINDLRGTSGIGVPNRLQEGLRSLPGGGHEDGFVDLD